MKPVSAIILAVAACLVGVAVGFRLAQPAAPASAEATTAKPEAVAPAPVVAAAPAIAPAAAPAPAPTAPVVVDMPAGIDYQGSPALGDPATAKVLLVEFSDFQCPVCKRAADEMHPILGLMVKEGALIVFKQNPLAMHKNAKPAALATAAAHLQGKFWAMHDKLFELNHLLGDDTTYTGVATGLGLDLAKFEADRKSPEVEARVMAEAKLATDLDAMGTPSYFVNGKKQVGWGSALGLKGMVDQERRAVDALMAAGKSREDAIRERIKLNSDKADVALKALAP